MNEACLISNDGLLDSPDLNLTTSIIGRPLLQYAQVGSTNDLAKQQARAGTAEGLVVLAEEQTAGRGRQGRGWAAPPGSSLLLSLLLRPAWLLPSDAFVLTMLAGVALCEAVEQAAPLSAGLKWPNDLLLPAGPGDQTPTLKAAGILSELELVGGQIGWVVIGMGVNVNWRPSGLVDGRDLAQVATSLAAAAGQAIDRAALLRALLTRLDARYAMLRQGRREELFTAWRARLATLGQMVRVRLPIGEISGIAESVDLAGALLLRDEHGVLHTILAGDVGG
jgi:BirA family transcriptional regulator, biotin operon repressor / biotin---[acetyl-CoA-carboxylase] ligase